MYLSSLLFLIMVGTVYATGNSNFTLLIVSSGTQCADGTDNDGDTLIDFPNDPGCTSLLDNDETNPLVCGNSICSGGETCGTCPSDCGVCPTPAPSGGSSGGSRGSGGVSFGGAVTSPTTVSLGATIVFSGMSAPGSTITVLKDSQSFATTTTTTDGTFSLSLNGVHAGTYTFALYATDTSSNRTNLYSRMVSVSDTSSESLSGIILSPTVRVNTNSFLKTVSFTGYTIPNSTVFLSTNGLKEALTTSSSGNGVYSFVIDTSSWNKDIYTATVYAQKDLLITQKTRNISFSSDESQNTIPADEKRFDLNSDGKINLTDFSILIYWYKKTNFPSIIDINKDGVIDIKDFSVVIYYWTG